jgi:hypothetical protein
VGFVCQGVPKEQIVKSWNSWPLLALAGVLASGCGGGNDDDDGRDVVTTVDGPASGGSAGSAGSTSGTGGGSGGATGADPYAYLRAGSVASGEEAAVWAGLPYTSIRLERHACYGACPDYSVEFTRGSGDSFTGPAEYIGVSDAERIGSFSGQIDFFSYGYMCQLLDELGFQSMDANYAAQWTDDSTVVLQATRADGTHRVEDYGRQGPPQLFALQLSIDATAALVEWTPR